MIKIDIDFNFNVLLKLYFSLSKKIIFFSPILANNNILLKIYCDNISFFFFPFFLPLFLSSTHGISFFLFPLFFSYTHVHVLFLSYPSFLFFSLPFLQTLEHSELFFFFFFLALRLLVLGGVMYFSD